MRLKQTVRKTGNLLKETFVGFVNDKGFKLSAALAFYTIFSLPPLVLVIMYLTGLFIGPDAVRSEIFGQIREVLGNQAATQVQEILYNADLTSHGTLTPFLGFVILIFGASGMFAEIQTSINYIWGLKAKPRKGLVKFLKNRLFSLSMIGLVGFLLLVGLIANSSLKILSQHIAELMDRGSVVLFHLVNTGVIFIAILILFMLIFKTLPDGKISFTDNIKGSLFTAVLFMIGQYFFSEYLGSSRIVTIYGAAGSVILILLWVYYSAITLYLGAEFTMVYARNHGKKIRPNASSEFIKKDDQ